MKYKDRIGEIVTGEIYQVRKKRCLFLMTMAMNSFAKNEQIPSDHFPKEIQSGLLL